MKGEERRKQLLNILSSSTGPVSGGTLSQELHVSRQIIVQDISLLRANGSTIFSTNKGYLLQEEKKYSRVFKVYHTDDQVEEELSAIVDAGGQTRDVFAYHKVYGVLKADMGIKSRRDIRAYMEEISTGKSSLLKNVTSGYHYHTIDAESEEILDAIQSMVANAQADGFILLYSKKDCPVAAYLRSEGLLHVIVGKAAQSANQTIYIDNDNALAGEEATDYLYEMGHRRIAYFGVSNAMLFSAERKRGYQMSLLKHDIPPREGDCVEIDTLNDSYEPALKALLTAPDRPTAVLVSDDILAVVLEQFCSKLGLRIPKDLSIVSFNNSLFSRITSPQLTTVDVNPYQLGMEAASQTINHIENPNLLATKIIVPHQLIVRESCCPPPEI